MEVEHRSGDDVPAWFLDTDYNELCFHVSQAFFPRTSAWDSLKKCAQGRVRRQRSGTTSPGPTSAPFEPGENRKVAVKVIDDRGNELLVVKSPRRGVMTDTSAFEVAEPILNSPFEEPPEHWQIEEGKLPERAAGTAPGRLLLPRPAAPPAGDEGFTRGEWVELELVNLIRERLAQWRADGYPGATRTTLELIEYWRRDGRERPLFFAQLEAAETIIFLREARSDLLQGIDVPLEECRRVEAFSRYACKMATGSGKTTVMGMLAAWSILNKVAARSDARFSDVVLVVCPNVTIRGRLRELDPNEGEASIYRTRDLVPPHLMPQLRRGRVLVKNWHEFERRG